MIYGIKDCANITLKDKAEGKIALYSDYANVATNEWTSERVFATSKGARAISWDGDKQSTFTLEMEVFELKWLAILAGTEISTSAKEVLKREVVVGGVQGAIAIPDGVVEGSVSVFELADDLVTHVSEVVESSSTYTGTAGKHYAVFYMKNVTTGVKSFSIDVDKFPKAFEIYADTLIRERETQTDEFVQMYYPLAKPQGQFTITMSASEPTTISVTFDLMPNAQKQMAIYTVIDE